MLLRILKGSFAVMYVVAAVACIGADPEEIGEDEAEDTEEAASAVTQEEAAPDDASLLPIPPGCGDFQQRCCAGNVCKSYLECDPATLRCLY